MLGDQTGQNFGITWLVAVLLHWQDLESSVNLSIHCGISNAHMFSNVLCRIS